MRYNKREVLFLVKQVKPGTDHVAVLVEVEEV
jgi:hypothetical protein